MMTPAKWPVVCAYALCLAAAGSMAAQVSQNGSVSGTVLEATGKTPLVGASVTFEGDFQSATTDRSGRFDILNIPKGNQKLSISYLGFEAVTRDIVVEGGKRLTLDISLEPSLKTIVTVYGEPLLMGQAKALNEQLNAVNIKNVVSADQIGRFPDSNTAEAAQRIPDVSIERDQGEGRYIIVRGTEPRLNSTMINGERIPSPEGDVRQVALDVIPADLLEAIEVTKALTQDMDADAIGGAVNVVTKRAPNVPRISLTLGGG